MFCNIDHRTELRELVQTEVGCLMSLQSNDDDGDKNKITTTLLLLSSALRHLDMETEVEIRESIKSVLELVSMVD